MYDYPPIADGFTTITEFVAERLVVPIVTAPPVPYTRTLHIRHAFGSTRESNGPFAYWIPSAVKSVNGPTSENATNAPAEFFLT